MTIEENNADQSRADSNAINACRSLENRYPRTDEGLPYLDLKRAAADRRKLIGIDGYWYDITKFIPYHPGGYMIEKFLYKDATSVFNSMHEKNVLGRRKPVAYYERQLEDHATLKFRELHHFFKEKGYFKTDLKWYSMKILITFSLWLVSVTFLVYANNLPLRILGGILLAAFWQQCGFHLHDFMHNQVFHDRTWDQRCGTLFGTALLGLSASWWRDEHFVHHALTNTVDYESNFVDPQMHEPSWAQNKALFPLHSGKLETFLISVQHYIFVPVCIFLGRPYIILDAMLKERHWFEWMAFTFHCSWTYAVFKTFPSYTDILIVYSVASSLQGILHVQLLLNHYAKAFFKLGEICESKEWYRAQIESNLNIVNPEWLDWFHGGLNLHICHHLYPLMPRHNYRKASVHIRQLCRELGIDHHELCPTDALIYTLRHLKNCGELFVLDPR